LQGGSGEVVVSRGKVNSFGPNWGMDDDLGVGLFLYFSTKRAFVVPRIGRHTSRWDTPEGVWLTSDPERTYLLGDYAPK